MSPIEVDEANRRLALGLSMALAASGRTRQEVASAAGISTTHVTKLLSGQSNPSQRVLSDFAQAVGHSVAQIYQLGDAALEREQERRRREAVRRAVADPDVEAIAEAASRLGPEAVDALLQQLERWKAEYEDQRSMARGGG